MKDERYDNQTYYEVSSFFRDSWVEMPDGKSESRMMRPRAVVRDEEKLDQSKVVSQEDTQSAMAQDVTNEPEKQKNSRTSLKEYAFVPASAIYVMLPSCLISGLWFLIRDTRCLTYVHRCVAILAKSLKTAS